MDTGKVKAIAMITDPTAVATKRSALGQTKTDKGAIYVSIPELGFEGVNLIYCRYGLSIPYFQVQVGWTLWVEPSIASSLGGTDRWIYTGFADCGGDITPASADQMILQFLSQAIYASTTGTLHLSSKTASEAILKGDTLQPWCEAVDAAITMLLDWAQTGVVASASGVDLGGIAPLAPLPTDYPDFPEDSKSTKVFTE